VTDEPADRDRPDAPPPPDGGAVATLEWVLDHVDEHIVAVGDAQVAPVMAAAWALGFAGATRQQVWWVLRDDRLRTAFTSMCTAMGRVRAGEVPGWLQPVAALEPSVRAAMAARAEGLPVDDGGRVGVGPDDPVLLAIVRGHDDARTSPGGAVAVPREVVGQVCDLARSVTAADIARLLDRARPPFETRLAEAAAVAAEKGVAFHTRKSRDAA
jgi:hypothetical protein